MLVCFTDTHKIFTVYVDNILLRCDFCADKLPYFDAASVLRSPQRCEVQGDGVHVQMWVDIVRAQILLNHLCDENNEWVGGIESFM